MFVIFKRELKVKASYRLTAVITIISAISGLLSYAFLGNGAVVSTTTTLYGMSLASFLISGVAFGSIVSSGVSMFAEFAGPSQIEEVMVTPTDFRQFILASSILSLLISLATTAIMFTVGVVLFNLTYSYHVGLLVAMILLGIASSIGLGLIGLGFQIVYKQTYFLSWLLYSFTGLVGNMIVPIQVLPGFLQSISLVTPQYYFFTGIRVALGSTIAPASGILLAFTGYTLVLLLTGFLSLNWALRSIRRNGTHAWS